jgi:hypothetical protein
MPHPNGMIMIDLKKNNTRLEGRVSLPQGLEGVFIWRGDSVHLMEGSQDVVF